jgi:glyoxylase-like metal-dependent hydrolase (beta-lactamase superfamily II)
MTAEVKILVEGCTNADSVEETGEEKTRPTITLVRDKNLVMVVDPGVLENQKVLVDALAKENLAVKDVNFVFITHSHIDHYRNAGMFPDAKIIEYFGIWEKLTVKNWAEDFTENIKIIHTPGHDVSAISLLVKTDNGVVAICGDVFWKENYPQNPHDDAFASNPERLRESREAVLKMADFVIPGHGPMYKNDRNAVRTEEEQPKPAVKVTVTCKKCGRQMIQHDKCQCRPYLCFRCCECGMDCDACSCSHKK